MKRVVVVLFIFVFLSSPSFARNKDSATVRFSTPVIVDSKNLSEGIYTMTWTVSGADASVSFARNKTVIVTVPAKLAQAQNNPLVYTEDKSSVVTELRGGATVVEEIQLPHLNLLFADDGTN